ncbi:FAD-binding protein [Amycolatopsis rhabdoformis]|uniref:FAD-binding protein n=1 Tax=Amycolatopsis rhabdoformis TaxID=1448059 RepID=A0ABZ1HY81_9PSEU|nr:FAD-binding protein [Amycolatopsis rhabdoformis]WSE26814.1 FAD-binding protein [Amycolatopsis rhabdoformis]
MARRLAGPVVLPGAAGFEAECETANPRTPLRPAVAVGAATVADVQEVVRFAAERALPIAVLGGGHQVASSGRGAVLINLSRLAEVDVEPVAGIARVRGSARWGEVAERAGECGLAALSASSATVGVIGYHLGGGHSPILGRVHGYAADHVRALQLVTADGVVHEVTAGHELFWALRGGKGNFGVVTAIEFALFPVKSFYGGGLYIKGEHAAAVLHAWREWAPALPREMSTSLAIRRRPETLVHVRFASTGPNPEAVLAPLRAVAPAERDTIAETPYRNSHQLHLDPPAPDGWVERSTALRTFPAEAAEAVLAAELDVVELRALGGALADEPAVPNAVAGRGAPWVVTGSGRSRAQPADLTKSLAPWSTEELNANLLTDSTTPDEVRAAYGPARYERLAGLKRRYDPHNLFRVNHTIVPR